MFTPRRITPLSYRKYRPKLSVFEFVKRLLLVGGSIGSAVDGVIGSDTIIAVTFRVNIGGVPGQGDTAERNFKSAVPCVNGGGSRSGLFVGRKREVFVAVSVFSIVAVFAAQIGGASQGLSGQSIGAEGTEKVGGPFVGKDLRAPWIINAWKFIAVVGDIEPDSGADLAEVGLAGGGFCLGSHFLEGGGNHSCQHADDRDHDEELNKGKSILAMDGAGNGIILPSELHVFAHSDCSVGIVVRGSFYAWHGRSLRRSVQLGKGRS